ncbi:rRNA biogenesis protein rrp36, partial [Cryomyces antarcticus]
MPLPKTLNRNLRARARAEESDDEPYSDELEGSSPSILDTGEGDKIVSSDEDTDEDVENL